MSRRRGRKTAAAVTPAVDVSLAVPRVIGHRVIRLALAGAQPSARDRKEFECMGAERSQESWRTMGAECGGPASG